MSVLFNKYKLKNGIRVVLAPLPEAETVAVGIGYAAGSRYEERSNNGIAHFTEHMFFKGTERYPTARDLSAAIEGIGGEFNAGTSKEFTIYHAKAEVEHLPTLLGVLADMLLHSKFSADEIEREKGVIIQEINRAHELPPQWVYGMFEAALYGNTPLGWSTLGPKENIEQATQATFLNFIAANYGSAGLVIGIAGRVSESILPELEHLFGNIPAQLSQTPIAFTATPREPVVTLETRPIDQTYLRLGVPGLSYTHPDRAAADVLTTILGQGMSSRLFTEVREKRGLAYNVGMSSSNYTDAGALCVSAGLDVKKLDEAIITIKAELTKLTTEEVPTAELLKAKNFTKGGFLFDLETPESLMVAGVLEEVLTGETLDIKKELALVEAVSAADVQRVAKELLGQQPLTLALIGPFDDVEHFKALIS